MTLLYIVSIPKYDEEGEYREDHYFRNPYNATLLAMANGMDTITSGNFNSDLAEQIAED